MQHVSGFLASDGRFFLEEEDCKRHEHEATRITGIQRRRMALIEALRTGAFEDLPNQIHSLLSDDEDWFTDTWNEIILPIIYADDIHARAPTSISAEFHLIEKQPKLAELVINHVLHDSNPQASQSKLR